MNATELLLNLPAADNSSSAVGRVEGNATGRTNTSDSKFRETFSRTIKAHLSLNTPGRSGIEPNNPDKNPAIGNSNFTQKQMAADPERAADKARPRSQAVAYRENSPSSRPALKNDSARNTEESFPAAPQNAAQQTQTQASITPDAKIAEEQLCAIAEELESKARNGELSATDEQMQLLLLDLLALLLSAKDGGENLDQLAAALGIEDISSVENLNLTFFADSGSELFEQLSQLMQQAKEMDPELLEQVKLLIRLSGEQAIELDIAGIV